MLKIAPGMVALVQWQTGWIIGLVLTVFRLLAKSYPAYQPLELEQTAKIRLAVLRPCKKLEGTRFGFFDLFYTLAK